MSARLERSYTMVLDIGFLSFSHITGTLHLTAMAPSFNAPVDFPEMGTIIAGKYQTEDVLGRGGMGVVVTARHIELRQRVAIKFLLPAGMRIQGAHERFLREARAAAAIQSEHVARVLDVGTLEGGTPYMVMERLIGTDLRKLLELRRRLPPHEAVDLILQACEAIAEAHALGIIHRDLKPSNLFLANRPSGMPLVKVLDFGLSKMASEPGVLPLASLTATDVVVGSPHYMSPEQIRSLKHTDARTDIWALGVILYQLIAGRRPFEGDSLPALCLSIMTNPAVPLQGYNPSVAAALNTIILRCLEKDLDRRIQSVTELVQRLTPFKSSKVTHESTMATAVIAPSMNPSFTNGLALDPGARGAAPLVPPNGSPQKRLVSEALPDVVTPEPVAQKDWSLFRTCAIWRRTVLPPPPSATAIPAPFDTPSVGRGGTIVQLVAWEKSHSTPQHRRRLQLLAGSLGVMLGMLSIGVVIYAQSLESPRADEAHVSTVVALAAEIRISNVAMSASTEALSDASPRPALPASTAEPLSPSAIGSQPRAATTISRVTQVKPARPLRMGPRTPPKATRSTSAPGNSRLDGIQF